MARDKRACAKRDEHSNMIDLGAPGCFPSLALLRKEVIQPHLPIRLPCYDFTLIIYPTFDG